MALIDFDKFLASFITEMRECSQMRNFSIPRCIKKALVDQGLDYKGGEIIKTQCRVSAEAKENGYGESEDERVREDILAFVKREGQHIDKYKWHNWIAWLEKQGEQKSIWHNEDEEPQRGSLILLIMQSGTPIVAKIIEPNHTFNHGERWAYIDDLLEKQWDAEKLELRKIEHKPAEWSEEDEGFLNLLFAIFTNEHPNGVFTTDNITVFKGNCVTSNRIVTWLKSLKDRVTDMD